jgi:hypothetical protein
MKKYKRQGNLALRFRGQALRQRPAGTANPLCHFYFVQGTLSKFTHA